MTIRDLLQLMRRYLAIVILVPLICVLACAGWLVTHDQEVYYTSTAYAIVANGGQLSVLNGTATSAARGYSSQNPGYSASAKVDTASLTVTVTARGPEGQKVAEVADSVMDDAVRDARTLLGKEGVSVTIEHTHGSSRVASTIPWRSVPVALIAGLFVAICAVVIIDYVKRPIKSAMDLASSSDQPVLGRLPGSSDEILLANIRFACGDSQPQSVCVVPVGAPGSSSIVAASLTRAHSEDDSVVGEFARLDVRALSPLAQDVFSAYASHTADAVVLTARQWVDSRRSVEYTIAELALAKARVIGCVLIGDDYRE